MNESDSIDQVLLKKVQEAIEKNYSDSNYGVRELALDVGLSRAHLYRRLQSLTGKGANQIIREFRLEKAFKLLQMRVGTISEVAYQVGFSSPSYFNTCFSEYFGYSPGKVKHLPSSGILQKFSIPRKFLYFTSAFGIIALLVLILSLNRTEKNSTKNVQNSTQISIAVLPFKYLSEDPNYYHLAEAMMDEIILYLSYNQELRVMPRISVEKYRSKDKNLKQIARELSVEYILDGSLQKQGDRVNVSVDLVHARTSRIEWKDKYSGSCKDILTIQSQIGQRIARELDFNITPDVDQIIEKISNTSPDAADFYWRGYSELNKWRENSELNKNNLQDPETLEKADRLFHEAIRMDSAYARAYVGLARVYWRKHFWDTFLSEKFADSALILANKALSFDRQLADAYVVKGLYYQRINNKEQALEEFDNAISLNPSSSEAYRAKAELYFHDDLVNRIENLHKAAELERGEDLPYIYRILGWGYGHAGFKEIACNYIQNALELDGDSAEFYMAMSEIEHEFGDFKKAIDFGKKSYAIDSTHWYTIFYIGLNYSFLDNPEEYLKWLKRYEEIQFKSGYTITFGTFYGTFRLAHAYGINGFNDEVKYYITEGLAIYDRMLELNRHYRTDIISFYKMAAIHAFQGNKEKAYEYLNQVNNRQRMPLWMIPCIDYDPMFDSLREEPQFQQIVRDVEAKYQAEHERVRRWMEENELL